MKKSLFFQVIAILSGVIFIASGLGKAMNTTAFAYIIYGYHLGYAFLLAPVIPVIEVFLGFMLILRIYPRAISWISVGFLLFFTIMFTYGLFAYQIRDCGCFGEIKALQLPVWATYTRNFLLMVMLIIIGFKKIPVTYIHLKPWKMGVLSIALVATSILSGFSFKLTTEESETTHPWQGKAIKETKLPQYIHTCPDSTYLCFVFSWKCYHCWNSIENIKSYKTYHVVDSIIGISFQDETNEKHCRKYLDINFPVLKTSKDSIRQLTEVLPTMFIISHDTVKVAFQSEIPSHLTLLGSSLEKKSDNIHD